MEDSNVGDQYVREFRCGFSSQTAVNNLAASYGLSAFNPRLPAADERPDGGQKGEVAVFKFMLELGVEFPLPEIIKEFLDTYGLSPFQLLPNGWRVLYGFISLCKEKEVEYSQRLLSLCYNLKPENNDNEVALYTLSAKRGKRKGVDQLENSSLIWVPRHNEGWRSWWFFVRLDLEGVRSRSADTRKGPTVPVTATDEERQATARLYESSPHSWKRLLKRDKLLAAGLITQRLPDSVPSSSIPVGASSLNRASNDVRRDPEIPIPGDEERGLESAEEEKPLARGSQTASGNGKRKRKQIDGPLPHVELEAEPRVIRDDNAISDPDVAFNSLRFSILPRDEEALVKLHQQNLELRKKLVDVENNNLMYLRLHKEVRVKALDIEGELDRERARNSELKKQLEAVKKENESLVMERDGLTTQLADVQIRLRVVESQLAETEICCEEVERMAKEALHREDAELTNQRKSFSGRMDDGNGNGRSCQQI